MTSLEQRVVRICWMDGDRKSDSPLVLSASLRKKMHNGAIERGRTANGEKTK